MRIIIDPGHGANEQGGDPGAVDPVQMQENDSINTREHELTFDIAKRTKSFLEKEGFVALLTRNENQPLSLTERAAYANQVKADLFVSIHLNAAGDNRVRGIEVFSYPDSEYGAILRNCILTEVMGRFKDWINRGAKTANFAVLRETTCPAALIECGFITNPEEEKRINDSYIRERFAAGIAAGIIKFIETRYHK